MAVTLPPLVKRLKALRVCVRGKIPKELSIITAICPSAKANLPREGEEVRESSGCSGECR